MSLKDTLASMKGFFGTPASIGDQIFRDFLQLNYEEITRRMRLEKRGCERGKNELPSSDSLQLGEVEQEIKALFEGEHRSNLGILNDELSNFSSRISSLHLDKVPDLQIEINQATGEYQEEVSNGLNKIRITRRKVIEINEEVDDFKADNRLKRAANVPLSRRHHFAILLALLMFEALVNGNMLGAGIQGGLIGGIGVAFVIALVNVGLIGWFFSLAFRYTHHNSIPKKLFAGVVPTLFWGCVTLFLNFVVSHYRDALQNPDIINAGTEALSRAFAFQLPTEAESLFLFVLGVLFCVGAGIDWLKMDDPYPGYGSLARRHDAEESNYFEEVAQTQGVLEELHADTTDALLDLRNEVDHKEREFRSVLGNRIRKIQEYKAAEAHNRSVAQRVVSTYRDANRRCRKTPVPPHFEQELSIATQDIDIDENPKGEISLAEVENDVKRVKTVLESGIAEIHNEWTKAQDEFARTHQLAREELNLQG
jgi:hypothetical protein